MRSWKAEFIADSSGKWAGNVMRYSTKEIAEAAARDLTSRVNVLAGRLLVREWRVVVSDDEPNDKS